MILAYDAVREQDGQLADGQAAGAVGGFDRVAVDAWLSRLSGLRWLLVLH